MKSTFSVIYYLKRQVVKKDGTVPVMGRITVDGSQTPLRAYDYATTVAGNKDERTVFVFDKFTIPADKVLVVEMHEKSGGRHQTFTVESEDIVRAKVINELKVK